MSIEREQVERELVARSEVLLLVGPAQKEERNLRM